MLGPLSSFSYCGCTWFEWLSSASDVDVKHSWDLKDWSFLGHSDTKLSQSSRPPGPPGFQGHFFPLHRVTSIHTGLQEALSQRQEQELHILGWDQDFNILNSATYQGFIKIQNRVVGTNMPKCAFGWPCFSISLEFSFLPPFLSPTSSPITLPPSSPPLLLSLTLYYYLWLWTRFLK